MEPTGRFGPRKCSQQIYRKYTNKTIYTNGRSYLHQKDVQMRRKKMGKYYIGPQIVPPSPTMFLRGQNHVPRGQTHCRGQ